MKPGSPLILVVEDKGVSADLTSKKDTGEILPIEQLQDITRDAVNDAWDKEEVANRRRS
jgi:hypothetical protein